ncbi:MAG: FHA domain-containing protein, partial [Elusimicrobia bacterium]|nr:FHA domain-containing protein [Elusimicrobiota bacterium]
MPKFLLKFNAAVIKEVPITKESLSIGRKEDNDIVIDNPAVSSHHCK